MNYRKALNTRTSPGICWVKLVLNGTKISHENAMHRKPIKVIALGASHIGSLSVTPTQNGLSRPSNFVYPWD